MPRHDDDDPDGFPHMDIAAPMPPASSTLQWEIFFEYKTKTRSIYDTGIDDLLTSMACDGWRLKFMKQIGSHTFVFVFERGRRKLTEV